MYTCIKDRAIDVRLYLIEDFNKVQVTCGKKSNFPQLPVRRKKRFVVVFYHDNTEDVELHAVNRWVKVEQEGNIEQYFLSDDEEDAEEDPTHPSTEHQS